MPSIRTPESIATPIKSSSTVITFGASTFNIGAQQYRTLSPLTITKNTVGAGGVDATIQASSLYYLYAVINLGTPSLIGSLNSSLPAGYTQARLVGNFTTDSSSNILSAYAINGYAIEQATIASTTTIANASSAAAVADYRDNYTGKLAAASGHTMLPGGLIIQWGEYTGTLSHGSYYSPTFARAFPTACYQVVVHLTTTVGTPSSAGYSHLSSFNTTGFTFQHGWTAGGSGPGTQRWIAIGY
jgi:hypothetical protein